MMLFTFHGMFHGNSEQHVFSRLPFETKKCLSNISVSLKQTNFGCFQNQNQNQFYFRVDVKTLKQLWATIGDREVAKPTIISALNLFRACTLNGIPLCNT
jgi:hypothetical protein